jgi:hypothetical protein
MRGPAASIEAGEWLSALPAYACLPSHPGAINGLLAAIISGSGLWSRILLIFR